MAGDMLGSAPRANECDARARAPRHAVCLHASPVIGHMLRCSAPCRARTTTCVLARSAATTVAATLTSACCLPRAAGGLPLALRAGCFAPPPLHGAWAAGSRRAAASLRRPAGARGLAARVGDRDAGEKLANLCRQGPGQAGAPIAAPCRAVPCAEGLRSQQARSDRKGSRYAVALPRPVGHESRSLPASVSCAWVGSDNPRVQKSGGADVCLGIGAQTRRASRGSCARRPKGPRAGCSSSSSTGRTTKGASVSGTRPSAPFRPSPALRSWPPRCVACRH